MVLVKQVSKLALHPEIQTAATVLMAVLVQCCA
jgi:hypothetical protein